MTMRVDKRRKLTNNQLPFGASGGRTWGVRASTFESPRLHDHEGDGYTLVVFFLFFSLFCYYPLVFSCHV